jgi:thioredoxin 1
MNMRNTLLLTAYILSTLPLQAAAIESSIIPFKELVDEIGILICHDSERSSLHNNHAEIQNILRIALDDEMCTFFENASQIDDFRDLIEDNKTDIQSAVVELTDTTAERYTQSLFDTIIKRSIGYLALQRVLNNHENVILQLTAPWCPPCQFFQPALEQCAKDYASNILFINVDITQHAIMGIDIESIPTYIFFKEGKEVYRQTGLNIEAVTKKYSDPNCNECKEETLKFLKDDIRLCIECHLLS